MKIQYPTVAITFCVLLSPKKDRVTIRKNAKFSTSSTKEAMTISKARPVHNSGGSNPEEKRTAPFKDMIRRCPTLKEL